MKSSTAFIICGALGREIVDIIQKYGWDAEVVGVSATDHLHPQRIAPDVEARILDIRQQYHRVIVIFGDCGSMGALDTVLEQHQIERISGLHCYEWFGNGQFQELMEEEPGTFFLTDFLVRAFRGAVVKGLGLDRYPELKVEYFRNYKRLVYLMQRHNPDLMERAQQIAAYLELPLQVHYTGYGLLETQLVELMEGKKCQSI